MKHTKQSVLEMIPYDRNESALEIIFDLKEEIQFAYGMIKDTFEIKGFISEEAWKEIPDYYNEHTNCSYSMKEAVDDFNLCSDDFIPLAMDFKLNDMYEYGVAYLDYGEEIGKIYLPVFNRININNKEEMITFSSLVKELEEIKFDDMEIIEEVISRKIDDYSFEDEVFTKKVKPEIDITDILEKAMECKFGVLICDKEKRFEEAELTEQEIG